MPWDDFGWKHKGPDPSVMEAAKMLSLEEDEIACDCCGHAGVDLAVYQCPDHTELGRERRKENLPPYQFLCNICANTHVGTWNQYPMNQMGSDRLDIGRVVAYAANEVISKLVKRTTH